MIKHWDYQHFCLPLVGASHHSAQEIHGIPMPTAYNRNLIASDTTSITNSSLTSPTLLSCDGTSSSSGTDNDSNTDTNFGHADHDDNESNCSFSMTSHMDGPPHHQPNLPSWPSSLFSDAIAVAANGESIRPFSLSNGLGNIPDAQLIASIGPILDELKAIDAEELLNLQRVTHPSSDLSGKGAVVDDGIWVHPIHDSVEPPTTSEQGQAVRYIHLDEFPEQYSMGIFIFPPHAKIPLHDHPGMCVVSRILYGEVHRLSLDLPDSTKEASSLDPGHPHPHSSKNPIDTTVSWMHSWRSLQRKMVVDGDGSSQNMPQQHQAPHPNARLVYQSRPVEILEAPAVTALYPYEGNLHEFIAGPNGAAVLDVLLPPYDADRDRDCTFYNIIADPTAINDNRQRSSCWIVPTGQPEDFHCISGRYGGMGAS